MAIKFRKITRANQRNLKSGEKLEEHGITFERLSNGDGRYTINIMADGQRIHRVIGKESEGVTRLQAEELIAKLRTDARQGRLNLPKGRKAASRYFRDAHKSFHVYAHENDATNILLWHALRLRNATMALRH